MTEHLCKVPDKDCPLCAAGVPRYRRYTQRLPDGRVMVFNVQQDGDLARVLDALAEACPIGLPEDYVISHVAEGFVISRKN